MQKFSIGDKVKLIHTRKKGMIKGRVAKGIFLVEVDKVEIPVHKKDIEAITDEKKEQINKLELSNDDVALGRILTAFLPMSNLQGELKSLKIHLINNLNRPLYFVFKLFLGDDCLFKIDKKVSEYSSFYIADLNFDQLNESPKLYWDIVIIHPDIGQSFTKVLRPNPKWFFKEPKQIPILDEAGFYYPLLHMKPVDKNKLSTDSNEEQFVEVDTEFLKAAMLESSGKKRRVDVGHFDKVIDLHIENLSKDHRNLADSEKFDLQMKHFHEAFDQAIINGHGTLTVIHGLGKGKLKSAIHAVLRKNQSIRSYSNDYDNRFGYGATVVHIS